MRSGRSPIVNAASMTRDAEREMRLALAGRMDDTGLIVEWVQAGRTIAGLAALMAEDGDWRAQVRAALQEGGCRR